MIAVKRTSLLFAVLWGALFFHEAVGPRRLFAALLMLAGVGILATS
jgi:drug/metabolite transporter (DMT)-like permease